MRHAEPGFAADDVVVSSGVNLANSGFDVARARVFEDAVLDRLRATPGVESVAFARTTPFTYRPFPSAQIAVPGYVVQPGEQPMADFNQVGPDFLSTLGIPILRGRGFRRSDDATGAPVAVVDETMAARFWRGADPVDSMMNVDGKAYRVIGIARATKKDSLQEAPQPFFYVSRLQSPSLTMALFMRTRLAPAALRPVVSQAIHDLAPDAPASLLTTLRQNIDLMSWSQRVGVQMLSVFGAIALLLAAVGLYGVMASSVAQGTRELALRMALGARPPDVLRLVLSKGLFLTTVGVAVGIGAALELTRLLGTMLYGVSPRDPMSFTIAATVIVVASLIACVIPAWKATRTDPLTALRS
jgi:predicted permease